jgi:hypothetical protein
MSEIIAFFPFFLLFYMKISLLREKHQVKIFALLLCFAH